MKISLVLPHDVRVVMDKLCACGFEAYLVGGCVRDTLLGRPVQDYDIATSARPAEVVELFDTVLSTGIQHGTVTVIEEHLPIEVTTYRIDGKYSDGRHPDTVQFALTVTDDLARRDFTMNAIAVDLHGDVVDPFDGQSDLEQRTIRAVGPANTRFKEDGLRILRGLRFAAELEFSIENETLDAMHVESSRLQGIAAQRIGHELARIAKSKWWFIMDLLATGNWLHDTRPDLTSMKAALKTLRGHVEYSQAWYKTMDELPETIPDKRQLGFLSSLLSAGPTFAESLVKACIQLGWKKKLCRQAYTAAELAREDIENWTEQRWRQILFHYDVETVEVACRLSDWFDQSGPRPIGRVGSQFGIEPGNARRLPKSLDTFQKQRRIQPLFSLNDLVLSGTDIANLGAAGPVIGNIKRHLAHEVLLRLIENDRTALLQRAVQIMKETLADDD